MSNIVTTSLSREALVLQTRFPPPSLQVCGKYNLVMKLMERDLPCELED